MAAAYLFHIVRNHPFVDGNKRAGLLTALVFLDVNGISIIRPSEDLYALTIGVAEGRFDEHSRRLHQREGRFVRLPRRLVTHQHGIRTLAFPLVATQVVDVLAA